MQRFTKAKSKERTDQGYKGLFYNDTSEVQYFEFGAHFRYKDLYSRLEILKQKNEKTLHKEILKTISKSKKIRMNIFKQIRKKDEPKNPSTINVINNNNINLTNFNVNLNLNVNGPNTKNIIENIKQIESKILKGVPLNQILSRNVAMNTSEQNEKFGFSSCCSYKNNHRNLTLYNAIKRTQQKNTVNNTQYSIRKTPIRQKTENNGYISFKDESRIPFIFSYSNTPPINTKKQILTYVNSIKSTSLLITPKKKKLYI